MAIAVMCWLTALAAIVAFRLVNGDIATTSLLRGQVDGDISPERVQLLSLAVFTVGAYLLEAITQYPALIEGKSMPEVSTETFTVMAVSQGLYLAGKLFAKAQN